MILDRIVATKRAVQAARAPIALEALVAQAAALPAARPFALALRNPARPQPRAIAEFKRRSPSGGAIRPQADPVEVARAYQRAGAAAISVLTDEEFFDGSLDHLRRVVGAVDVELPVLRKDFLLDARDVYESRLAGADAVLLIARLFSAAELGELVACARIAGLAALVEVHDERETEAALAARAGIIGVNHRDLDTLTIDLELSRRLRPLVGDSAVLVAESGIRTSGDVRAMGARGVDAILVGEALMRAPDPGAALATLLEGACS